MDRRQWLARAGSGISIPTAVIVLILFFVPWLKIRCSGPFGPTTIATSTGLQLAQGEVTLDEDFRQEQEQSDREPKQPDARPWFFLGLVLPVAIAAVGALGLSGKLPACSAGVALVLGGVAGLVVMVLAANVAYDELQGAAGPPRATVRPTPATAASQPGDALGQAMGDALGRAMSEGVERSVKLTTTATAAVWWSLALYVLVAICGAANLALPRLTPAAGDTCPGPPATP